MKILFNRETIVFKKSTANSGGLNKSRLKTRHILSSLILGLAASFNTAAAALSKEISYWRIPGHDAVFSATLCEERGICARVHYINPQDKTVREMFDKLKDKAESRSRSRSSQVIEDADIMSLCGYQPNVTTEQKSPTHWYGSFIALITDRQYTVNFKEISDTKVEVRLSIPYVPFLGRTMQAERIDNPPPACMATRSLNDVLKLKR